MAVTALCDRFLAGVATALFVPGDSRAGNANIAAALLRIMTEAKQAPSSPHHD